MDFNDIAPSLLSGGTANISNLCSDCQDRSALAGSETCGLCSDPRYLCPVCGKGTRGGETCRGCVEKDRERLKAKLFAGYLAEEMAKHNDGGKNV